MGLMRTFKREIRNVNGKVLAYDMRNGFGAALAPMLERIARGPVADSEIRDMFTGKAEADFEESQKRAEQLAAPTIVPGSKTGRFTALVSCHGIAMYDVEYQPYAFSTLRLSQVMGRLAADPTIETIFLDIDSPGGYVTGTQEAADAVYAARKKKAVVALVNPLAASAAYWIASQAETIIGVPSADVGSIGVFMCHYDCSVMLQNAGIKPTYIYAGEYKTEGNSSEPLSDEGRAFYQSEVDGTYSDFVNAVARGRGVSAQTVLDKFGKGRVYGAAQAKKLGMIDDISTIQGALASWGIPDMSQEANRRRAESDQAVAEQPAAEGSAEPAYDKAAMVPVLKEEGCGCIVIRAVSAPGSVTVYADKEWPSRVAIDPGVINAPNMPTVIIATDDLVTITVANGTASYRKLGETASGAWVCELMEGSTFAPPPNAEQPANDDPGAEAASEADAESARKAEAERVRLRIALLAAG